MFDDVSRTASWAKFSRPFGTNFADPGLTTWLTIHPYGLSLVKT